MKGKFTNTDGDTINKYFKEIRKIELLSPEEEVELAEKIQNGDEECIEKLVNSNLKFVVSIAKKYQGQGLLLEDLISEGNYGLVTAAKRFDPSKGFRFISYAVYWVKQAIIQSLNDNGRMIRLPVNVIGKLANQRKQSDKFEFEYERLPNDNEVLDEVEGEIYDEIITPTCTSLNNFINEDGDEVLEFIADETKGGHEPQLDADRVKNTLRKTLEILDERERCIIECYFGLNPDYEAMTLEGIGDKYELTKERIRQIKEKAIQKLRRNSTNLQELMNN